MELLNFILKIVKFQVIKINLLPEHINIILKNLIDAYNR